MVVAGTLYSGCIWDNVRVAVAGTMYSSYSWLPYDNTQWPQYEQYTVVAEGTIHSGGSMNKTQWPHYEHTMNNTQWGQYEQHIVNNTQWGQYEQIHCGRDSNGAQWPWL